MKWSPRFWLVTAAALAGMSLTTSLGLWQLRRAEQKLALKAAIEQRGALPPLDGQALAGAVDLAAIMHRRIALRGHWLAQHTVFLDNRPMQGRTGFFVVTPLQLPDPQSGVLLVQRGWVPRNFLHRTEIPSIPTPPGWVELQGRIAPPPSKLYAFAGSDQGVIRQNLDVGDFSAETGLHLLPGSLLQSTAPGDSQGDGLLRAWPEPDFGVDRHHGYAFQWFGLSGLMAVLYVWFQWVRPRRGT